MKCWVNSLDYLINPFFLLFLGPLKSVGHTATLFTDKSRKSEVMIAIFGYSPTFGFLNTVQEYHFGKRHFFQLVHICLTLFIS